MNIEKRFSEFIKVLEDMKKIDPNIKTWVRN